MEAKRKSAKPRKRKVKGDVVTIELPLAAELPDNYIGRGMGRLDLKLNDQTELPAFRMLHAGLIESGATVNGGHPVDTAADVIRWLFTQATSQMG